MRSKAWSLLSLFLGVSAQEALQKEADPALNCRQQERARLGDRILLDYTGLLSDGSTFDRGSADFVIGDKTVIKGFEEGMLGQCAGEKITMIVPPSFGNMDIRNVQQISHITFKCFRIWGRGFRQGSSQFNPLFPDHPEWYHQSH